MYIDSVVKVFQLFKTNRMPAGFGIFAQKNLSINSDQDLSQASINAIQQHTSKIKYSMC